MHFSHTHTPIYLIFPFLDHQILPALQALDFVISEAKKFNLRLILSLVNNWEAYGGKSQYVKWGKAAGLNLTSDDDFFSHPTLKTYYKAHLKVYLTPPYLTLNRSLV